MAKFWRCVVRMAREKDEDEEMIKQAQRMSILRNPSMAAAAMTGAQADAMKAAASNSAGAMSGFMGMGMGMASKAGGVDVQQLYQMGAQQQAAGQTQYGGSAQTPGNGAGQPDGQQGTWRCNCGAVNELAWKFCTNCGSPRPAQGWICTCGARNTGKFCTECGKPRPV